MRTVLLTAALTVAAFGSGTARAEPATRPSVTVTSATPKAQAPLAAAADRLARGLADARALTGGPDAQRPILEAAAREVIAQLGADWTASERLAEAIKSPDVATLAAALQRVERDLRFRPTIEAPVPPGWPAFTPADELELKTYPAYRAAFTTRSPLFLRESRNFWTLFNHIKERDIPMTAPVEMPLGTNPDGTLYEAGMGFLYPDSETGTPGDTDKGSVKVLDVAPMTVVNIAYRGKQTDTRTKAALTRLQAWVEANKDRYEVAAPPRVLGWNSPSMPDARSYTEVQIPLREKK